MSAVVIVLNYDRVTAQIEATERRAGVPVGTWRTADARSYGEAIRFGLRRATALEERAERLGWS